MLLRSIFHLRTPLLASLNRISIIDPPPSISSNTSLLFPPLPTHFFLPFSSHSSKQKTDEVYNLDIIYNKDPEKPPKLFVVQPRLRSDAALQAKLAEALNLANSLEEQRDGFFSEDISEKEKLAHVVVQNPVARSINSGTYFGSGTVKTIKCHIDAAETKDEFDAVFVNAILSGVQQRNLEREWGKPILDRVGLIIEIFHAHAQTKEAKLQSELAALMYRRSRLVRVRSLEGKFTFGASGEAEVVSARGRGSGGRGFISGAGETELQLQRRRILERRKYLLSQIEEVRRTRALQRASRRRCGGSEGQGLSTVAIVGYTNAGKSTLVNALSESDLYSDDRLFATVDPRVRSVMLPSGRKVLLSDTVGFISDLPVQLVEAFHATLEEVVEADLLVHVIDSSAVDREEQRSSVLEVLKQIGVPKEKLQNMIEVWNKIDLRGEGADESLCEAEDEYGLTEADDGTESDTLSEEIVDEDNSVTELTPGECQENAGERETDSLDDWKAVDDQQDSWEDWKGVDDQQDSWEDWKAVDDKENDSSVGLTSVNDTQGEFSDDNVLDADLLCQDVKPLETSAIMGIGLQEVLNIIDEKLEKQYVAGTRSFDNFNRKWRPPRNADVGTAVGQ